MAKPEYKGTMQNKLSFNTEPTWVQKLYRLCILCWITPGMMLKQDFKPVACLPIMVCRDYILSAVCVHAFPKVLTRQLIVACNNWYVYIIICFFW